MTPIGPETTDHDLLIRIDERLDTLTTVVHQMKADMQDRFKQDEDRITALERWRWYVAGGMASVLGAVELLSKFVK
jgi:hypothetical protein